MACSHQSRPTLGDPAVSFKTSLRGWCRCSRPGKRQPVGWCRLRSRRARPVGPTECGRSAPPHSPCGKHGLPFVWLARITSGFSDCRRTSTRRPISTSPHCRSATWCALPHSRTAAQQPRVLVLASCDLPALLLSLLPLCALLLLCGLPSLPCLHVRRLTTRRVPFVC